MNDPAIEPFGDVGAVADRDPATGRWRRGNRAALVVGATSTAFWQAQEGARREIANAVISDTGEMPESAPRALQLAADSIAQAALIQASAFARLVESGGPLTAKGRTRRAFAVWLQATDRLERHLRLVGLKRSPRPVDPLERIRAAVREASRRAAQDEDAAPQGVERDAGRSAVTGEDDRGSERLQEP